LEWNIYVTKHVMTPKKYEAGGVSLRTASPHHTTGTCLARPRVFIISCGSQSRRFVFINCTDSLQSTNVRARLNENARFVWQAENDTYPAEAINVELLNLPASVDVSFECRLMAFLCADEQLRRRFLDELNELLGISLATELDQILWNEVTKTVNLIPRGNGTDILMTCLGFWTYQQLRFCSK
jgi:hypothetical protein